MDNKLMDKIEILDVKAEEVLEKLDKINNEIKLIESKLSKVGLDDFDYYLMRFNENAVFYWKNSRLNFKSNSCPAKPFIEHKVNIRFEYSKELIYFVDRALSILEVNHG